MSVWQYTFISFDKRLVLTNLSWMEARIKFNTEVKRKELGEIERVNCTVIRGDKIIATPDRQDPLPIKLLVY